MNWRAKLRRAVIFGIVFSILSQLPLLSQGIQVSKLIDFAALFAGLYFLWLLLVPDKREK